MSLRYIETIRLIIDHLEYVYHNVKNSSVRNLSGSEWDKT